MVGGRLRIGNQWTHRRHAVAQEDNVQLTINEDIIGVEQVAANVGALGQGFLQGAHEMQRVRAE